MATRYLDLTSGTANFTTASNWSADTAPTTGDTVYAENSSAQVIEGLSNTSLAVAYLNVGQSFTGYLGSSTAPLTFGASTSVAMSYGSIGYPGTGTSAASGSGRVWIDTGSGAATYTVHNTASTAADTGREPCRLLFGSASSVLNVLGGRVGVATTYPTETATVGTVNVSGTSTVVNLGSGVTITTLNQSAGSTLLQSAITTVNLDAGTLTTRGDFTVTTANARGGTVYLNHTKTAGNVITTLNLYDGVVIDCTGNPNAINVGTINVYGDATIRTFPGNRGAFTWTTLNRLGGTLTLA